MSVMALLHSNNKLFLKRFAELIAVNGGAITLHGTIGKPEPTEDNRYKRKGLTFEEACEMQYMRGIFEGVLMSTNGAHSQEAQHLIHKEMRGSEVEIATPDQVAALLGMGTLGIYRRK